MAVNPFDQFDAPKEANPFDAFDQKEAKPAAPAKKPEDVGVGEYLWNQVKMGITDTPALIDLAAKRFGTIFSKEEIAKTLAPFAFQAQAAAPEVVAAQTKPVSSSLLKQYEESQAKFAGITGAEPQMPAPGLVSEMVGSGFRAASDPASYLGLGPVSLTRQALFAAAKKVPFRAGSEFLAGEAADIGGRLGAEAEKVITGEDTGIGRLVGGVGLGVGTAAPRQVAIDVLSNTIDQFNKNRKLLKATPEVSGIYAKGAAKNLLELAAKQEGAESVDALIALVNDASQFVNKSDAPLVIAMADNPVIRQQVERLAKTNPVFRQKVNDLVSQASQDIVSKTTKMFGERYGAEVPKGAGLKVKPVVARRKADIDREIDDLAEGVTPSVDQETLGNRILNLVEERKKAARAEVSPDYEKLLDDARTQGIKMPEEGVGAIYDFVNQNNIRDIFGKTSQIDKDIMRHLEPVEVTKPNPQTGLPETTLEHTPMSFDNVESLKKAINRIKRDKLSDEQLRKITQLEQVVDQARETIPGDFSKRLNGIDLKYYEKVGVPFGEQGIKDIDSKNYATQVAPIIVKNPESYSQFIRAVGKENGDVLAENAIISEVYQKAVKDGRLNAKALSKYMKDKAGVISQIDGLEDRLRQALVDDTALQNRMRSLDKAAEAAQSRVAENALTKFDVPDYESLTSSIINNPKMRQKIMRDIGDLDPETAKAVRKTLRAEAVNIGRRNANGFMAYVMDPANKAGIEAIFGESFQPALRKLALFSDKVAKADVNKLTAALDKTELDALARIIPGIDLPYLTSTLRDRISSIPHKVIRLVSKYNSSNLARATDDAIMELLLDPNGVQKLSNVATTLKFDVSNPASLGKIADSLSRVVPRAFYTSGKTAIAGETRAKQEQRLQEERAADFVVGGFEGPVEKADGGLITPGNIDVSNRPIVRNPDGSVSTVRSIGVNIDGKEVLIPTVVNGRVVSNKEAIDHYIKTGEHLGVFDSPQASTAFAQRLHEQEEQRTMKKARGGVVYTPAEQRLLNRYASR